MPSPKNKIREFICAGCGKLVRKSCVKGQKYCSAECYHAHRDYHPPKTGVYKVCVNCGKTFYAPKNRAEKSIACSVECHNAYQRRNKIHLICENCGKEFLRSPSFAGQKYCSLECRNKSPEFQKRLISMNEKQNKMYPNKFEVAAYSLMDSLGIKYEKQYTINGKFTVDAFVPDKNTVVQFDGDYWHGNPEKYKDFDKRQKKRMALDKSQDAYLETIGIKVIRIWQSDFQNTDYVKSVLSSLM